MDKQLKVVIITTKLPEDIWLVNSISDCCQIEGIIFPKGIRFREYGITHVLKKRIKQLSFSTLLNQILLVLYRRTFETSKNKRAIKEMFIDKSYKYLEKPDMEILEIDDVNSEAVRDYIINKSPDLVVVSGAPLLKTNIIEACQGRIINFHPGLTPQYRGRYGDFWPIYNREPDMVGATIHYIDKGVDTGPILMQQRVNFSPDDTLKMINYRQYVIGVSMLKKCLSEFDLISPLAYERKDHPSRNYTAPGLTHYLKAMKYLKKLGNGHT